MATTVFNRTPLRGCWSILIAGFVASVACTANTQIQQAWVARYNNGITTGTNQAVKMVLDAGGNIYVTGFSQNSNANVGYATIKYAPNGGQVWASRFDSTNYPFAAPSTLALDASNNVVVTGTALTFKYDTNGNELWEVPYAGLALTLDTNGNSYITGFGTSFNTVKLSSVGTNLWLRTFPATCGTATGQAVISDMNDNIYVAGSYPFFCESGNADYELLIIKYNANGSQMWTATYEGAAAPVQVDGVAVDSSNCLYVASSLVGLFAGYETTKYTTTGALMWSLSPDYDGMSRARGLIVDRMQNAIVTGKVGDDFPEFVYGTFKISTNGSPFWTNYYPQSATGVSVSSAIAVDLSNNSYVTGFSPGTNSGNDIVTIKYDQNGNQIWLQRYSSPGNGNAAGNAIAVDNTGNVYIAGYDTTTAGGTEMVLIKYSPITLQRKPDGTVLLETQGSPGESFDIEASIDLLNWLDLGTVLADTNGLMQFDDTNAPNFPSRFYYTNPQ
jgi:hypothetical protein